MNRTTHLGQHYQAIRLAEQGSRAQDSAGTDREPGRLFKRVGAPAGDPAPSHPPALWCVEAKRRPTGRQTEIAIVIAEPVVQGLASGPRASVRALAGDKGKP